MDLNQSSFWSEYGGTIFIAYAVIMVLGIILGFGEKRKIVIFRNYDDVGLTFLIPVSYLLFTFGISMIADFMDIQVNSNTLHIIGLLIASGLTLRLLFNTYIDNNKNIIKTLLSTLTKVPIGIIWVLNFIQALNPGGKTALERSKNRGQALVILTMMTFIMPKIIVENSGSLFNPASWVRGRRVGSSIRNSLN